MRLKVWSPRLTRDKEAGSSMNCFRLRLFLPLTCKQPGVRNKAEYLSQTLHIMIRYRVLQRTRMVRELDLQL